MVSSTEILVSTAHEIYARNGVSDPNAATRPPVFKVIGIALAIGSGAFIGTSFVLKKVGLLKANEKYNEVAGEGYGYLKNAYWWGGMTLMIVGEVCNFVAYAFTDAILVTPLGALSVVLTAILSAIFLKERLSMVGKVACFLCIVGSVVIVMNAPHESSVANIQQMQSFVIAPGFLSYAGVVIIGSTIAALYAGPRWGKKNMLVYISICSWIGGLSVVATQGLGAAILAQARGTPQFDQWFTYVLLAFVIATLLTEIIYLNVSLIIPTTPLIIDFVPPPSPAFGTNKKNTESLESI
jgi:magnesium transporter